MRRLPLFVSACIINFLYAAYFGMIGTLLPAIGEEFRIDSATQGQFFAANFLGYIPGLAVSGALSDRWGRKPVIMIGCVMFILSLILLSTAHSFGLCLIAAPFIGAGSGAMLGVSNALMADVFPERRSQTFSITQVIFCVGAASVPFSAIRGMDAGVSWRVFVNAVTAGLIAVSVVFAFQRTPPKSHSDSFGWNEVVDLCKDRTFQILLFAQICYVGAEVGYFQWMTTYLEKMPEGRGVKLGAVTTFWVAMGIGRFVSGLHMESARRLKVGILGAMLGCAASLVIVVSDTPAKVLISVALTGLLFAGLYLLIVAEMVTRFSKHIGAAYGAVGAVSGLSISGVLWLMGLISVTKAGWTGAMLIPPMLACATGGIFFVLDRREPKTALNA